MHGQKFYKCWSWLIKCQYRFDAGSPRSEKEIKAPGLYSREYGVDSIYSALCYIARCLCPALLCSVFALCVVMPVGSIEFTIIPHFPLSFFVSLSFSLSILLPLSFPLPYFLLLSLHSKLRSSCAEGAGIWGGNIHCFWDWPRRCQGNQIICILAYATTLSLRMRSANIFVRGLYTCTLAWWARENLCSK